MGVSTELRVKYGLSQLEPTNDQVIRWRDRVKQLVAAGMDYEGAGLKAAEDVFLTTGSVLYKKQADTVFDMLTDLAKNP